MNTAIRLSKKSRAQHLARRRLAPAPCWSARKYANSPDVSPFSRDRRRAPMEPSLIIDNHEPMRLPGDASNMRRRVKCVQKRVERLLHRSRRVL